MKSILIAVAFLLMAAAAQAQVTPSHMKAAEDLFVTMHMDKVMAESLDNMLAIQVKQNPMLAQYTDIMKEFLSKYMSWASLKDDMAKIYVDAFTEDELRQLNTFYKTDLGQKAASLTPVLMTKGAAIGQQRVQDHLSELQQLIMARMGESSKKSK